MDDFYRRLIILVLFIININKSLQSIEDNKVEDDYESGPNFSDLASGILSGMGNGDSMAGISAITGALGQFMQTEGGQEIGNILANSFSNNRGEILSGIGSMMMNKDGTVDPQMISNVINIFGSIASTQSDSDKDNRGGKKDSDPSLGEVFMGFLNGFSQKDGQFNVQNLLMYAPMLLQNLNNFNNEGREQMTKSHADHAWFMPPIVEEFHKYFDYFIHSDFGKMIYKNFGLEKIQRKFTDSEGKFDIEKLINLLENHSFRRYWIRQATDYVTSFVGYLANPQTQKKYFDQMRIILNGYLKSNHFPHQTLFDPKQPSDSISNLIDYSSKRYLSHKIDSAPYVRPAIKYLSELVNIAHSQSTKMFSFGQQSREISYKIAETINMEVLEPVMRAFRAYRFARRNPRCGEYVMCLVNQPNPLDEVSLPGLKMLLGKGTSLFASWFLTNNDQHSYWNFYSAIMNEKNCQEKYQVDCSEFHAEEVKVTTEYTHNEL